jgi:PAS domain S-box-containing protein
MMDSAGVITGWNPQAEKTFGWTRDAAIGRALDETIMPERHRSAHKQGLARYLVTGEAAVLNKRIEITALHREGHEFPVELAITPIRTDAAISFAGFIRDITERKLAEAKLNTQLERLSLLHQITRAIGARIWTAFSRSSSAASKASSRSISPACASTMTWIEG